MLNDRSVENALSISNHYCSSETDKNILMKSGAQKQGQTFLNTLYKTECNNAAHNATTHKTERNNTQDQTQQHTPLLNYRECFHVDATSELRKRLLFNDAGTNQCHRQTGKQTRQVVLDRAGPAI
jgi:hypothetical protein